MINREKILEILKQYHFDSDKYMVISGAAMVLYGIKEYTNDIDIAVTKEYYDYLLEKYDCRFDCYDSNGNKCYYIDNFINFGLKYYSNNKDYVEKIPVQNIFEILKLKKELNREKDIIDIEKINKYMLINNLKIE